MISVKRFRACLIDNSKILGICLFILTLVLNNLFDIPHIGGHVPLSWAVMALLTIVLNMHVIPQYWAKFWTKIKCGALENYICKGDYILPFTGKWCVFEGGTTKELSVGWSELILRYTYFFCSSRQRRQ